MAPHEGERLVERGKPLGQGSAVMILAHGRGAGPENILDLADALHHPELTYLAPAAAENTWYPYSFMADIARNEPGITSGLAVIGELVERSNSAGIPRDRIILGGFSQGACLMATFAARNAGRYGGVLVFSGGLIGPPGATWDYPGDFGGTPVFLGCSDVDSHVPRPRVAESAEVFGRMGAAVDERIYPGMGHLINEDEIAAARAIVAAVLG